MEREESPFNVWLKQRRRALDLTQEDLAERVGCSTITIQKIELGERRPSKQVAQRLADCLKIPTHEQDAFVIFARGDADDGQLSSGSASAARPTASFPTPSNLPAQLTPLIGREGALEAVCGYLLRPDLRLLTLTGVPGMGKTRLGLETAARLLPQFRDGVYFVELASVSEPDLVASTVATSLGCKDIGGGSHVDWLKHFIADRRILVVLDNFEQVLDAAPLVVEMLRACPALCVLVTSREALHIMGEQQFPVQPLGLPDPTHLPEADDRIALLRYPSVELFVQRARAVDPSFVLTEENYEVVAAICTRLEGLPLAIELAAARIKILTPADLFSHLDRRLKLLTGGPKHLPPRLQTLRGAIDWSYRLLRPTEQLLFARFGVFVGGATLQAIEAICIIRLSVSDFGLSEETETEDPIDVLEAVGSLVDKNLLRREASRSRFAMLEMVREYALEKLLESGDVEATKRAHALFFLKLAEEANLMTRGPEEASGLDRLEEENDNLRAALQWCLSREAGTGGLETGLRLVEQLSHFWYVRGYLSEGRERIASVLSSRGAMQPELKSQRAWALIHAGDLAFLQTDYFAVRAAMEEARDLFLEIGDKKGIAYTLKDLADTAREEGNYDAATLLFEQSLSIFRELGETHGAMVVLVLMSQAEMRRGFHAQATAHLEEALQIAQLEQSPSNIAVALCSLGEVMILQGEYQKAIPLLEESLALRRTVGFPWSIAVSLGVLGWAILRLGDTRRASEIIMESFILRKELMDKGGIAWCLEKFAEIEVDKGAPLRAARLLGAAKALRVSLHTEVDIADLPDYERTVDAARNLLGEQAFADAFEQGAAMNFEQIVVYAQSPLVA